MVVFQRRGRVHLHRRRLLRCHVRRSHRRSPRPKDHHLDRRPHLLPGRRPPDCCQPHQLLVRWPLSGRCWCRLPRHDHPALPSRAVPPRHSRPCHRSAAVHAGHWCPCRVLDLMGYKRARRLAEQNIANSLQVPLLASPTTTPCSGACRWPSRSSPAVSLLFSSSSSPSPPVGSSTTAVPTKASAPLPSCMPTATSTMPGSAPSMSRSKSPFPRSTRTRPRATGSSSPTSRASAVSSSRVRSRPPCR
jgi:hypothetical protein